MRFWKTIQNTNELVEVSLSITVINDTVINVKLGNKLRSEAYLEHVTICGGAFMKIVKKKKTIFRRKICHRSLIHLWHTLNTPMQITPNSVKDKVQKQPQEVFHK